MAVCLSSRLASRDQYPTPPRNEYHSMHTALWVMAQICELRINCFDGSNAKRAQLPISELAAENSV